MPEYVKLYKYHPDFHDNLELTVVEAIKQPTRYQIVVPVSAYSYRTYVYPENAHLSAEDAYKAKHEAIVDGIKNLRQTIVERKLMLKKLEALNPSKA